jgi:FAD/FMN-containing dehydrogenase
VVVTHDPDVRNAHSRDVSGLELVPEGVARAADAKDVIDLVSECAVNRTAVTAAGSQTSMTGASITDRGVLLSMRGMDRIVDIDPARRIARVEPGITIGELNRVLAEHELLFAPDPTSENDATIGGAIACNASGARSLYFGATRSHVAGVRVVHADGADSWYRRFRPEKNAVGYAAAHDPVDWFVGSEGTLGIVVETELSLVDLPADIIGLAVPFRSIDDALAFVVGARASGGRSARCLELFDEGALQLSSKHARTPWSHDARAMIYLEDVPQAETESEEILDYWLALSQMHRSLDADIRAYQSGPDLRDARVMRHAVPAAMNELGASFRNAGGRKVSTDWAVPYERLGEALTVSAAAIAKHGAPKPVTYGHAGNGHPHQNFIAEDRDSLARINAAVDETLRAVIEMGGTVSAEHGLGKLKKHWLSLQSSTRQIEVMKALKHSLDPDGILAPGNIL